MSNSRKIKDALREGYQKWIALRAKLDPRLVSKVDDTPLLELSSESFVLPFHSSNSNGTDQVLLIRNVQFDPKYGVLLNEEGTALRSSAFSIERAHSMLSMGDLKIEGAHKESSVVTCISPGERWANYYHYCAEAVSRLYPLSLPEFERFLPIKIYVDADFPGYAATLIGQLLPNKVELIEHTGLVQAEKFLYLPYYTSSMSMSLPKPVAEWMRTAVNKPRIARNRIYISRAAYAERSVLNEEELLPILEKHNITLVQPEKLSFNEQQELFASCELVIGVHGAGLTNLIWCGEAKVLEIFGSDPHWHYRDLCRSMGWPYQYIKIESGHKNNSLNVDPEMLDLAIGQLLEKEARSSD